MSVFEFSPGLLLSPRHHLLMFQMTALNQSLLLELALNLRCREGPPTPVNKESKGKKLTLP